MKKNKSQKSTPVDATKIKDAYRASLLTVGKRPISVFAFCNESGISENDFYSFFGSFDGIEKSIWEAYIIDTKNRLDTDKDFAAFTSREKILTFYFSLAERLKAERSFVVQQMKSIKPKVGVPTFLKTFKAAFEEWIEGALNEGKATGEIAKRPYVDNRYSTVFWMHLMFVLHFWANDESANFEKTDVVIEKSVTLAFDLIGKGVLDNALDLGKFLFQNSKW